MHPLHPSLLVAGIAPNLFAMEDKVLGRVCVGVGEGGGWVGVWIRPRTSPHYFHLGRQFPKYSYEYYVRNHAPLIGLEETKEISLCQQSHYNKIMYKAISTHKLISLWLNDGVCLELNHSFVLKRT